ncbi:MAG: DUF1566 domain-containing protein [Candidatus Desulfaltia sp.]|nr:DUF1566 domain-containing protein [Candidatus Desulfaltia sp.]
MVYNSTRCLLTVSKRLLILIPVLFFLLFSSLNIYALEKRFQDHKDGTITDQFTGLMWSKDADPAAGPFNWFQALDAVSGLNAKRYCGHQDWRLPNINELASLVDRSIYAPALPGIHPFLNIKAWYWTGTTTAEYRNHAWRIYFFLGNIDYGHKYHMLNYVWPVRTIDKPGKEPPEKRFYDYGDGTVTDCASKLMWTKNANLAAGKMNQYDAIKFVANLNAKKYCGYNNWRLPEVNELKSLVDYGKTDPVLPDGHPFLQTISGIYWSSESNIQAPNYSWCVDMKNSRVDYYNKNHHQLYVWPVRRAN